MNTKTLAILTMVILALTTTLASASDWTQFHCDVEHAGYSTSRAPNTDDIAWISDDIGAHSASSVTIADGRVFVYCWDYLVCLDEYTGAVLWNVSVDKTPDVCGSWVTPAYNNGCVFLSANETCCFNATDGSLVWMFEPPTGKGAVDGGCAIAEGNVITSDWDGRHYYCLNEDGGTEIWNFTVADEYAQSTPAISGGRAVFGSWTWGDGGHIYCVNRTTGSEEWNITTPDHPCGSSAISEGVVYMTTYDFSSTRDPGELYALSITDGSVLWSQPVERTDSTPALAYGNVYVCGGCKGFSDLMTYCFNATTGDLIWNTSASDEIGNWKCSVAVADGKAFVGKPYFEDGVMDYVGTCALDADTGEIAWTYPKGGSSPAVADGMVFTVGSGRVYAFAPTFWSGDVSLGSGTFNVTADDSGKEYTINRTCALAAIVRAAEKGGFNYTISDSWYESWGSLSVTSIAGRESDPVTWDGWCYWVNYPDDPMPMVGGNKFELNDGDVVEWYYGGMGSAPNNTDMLIRIETSYDFWSGDVSLGSGTFNVTADSGAEYTINRTCALASIIGAAEKGGFNYTINDSWYESYGTIYVDAIDGVSGWMYWVNYPDDSMPMVGANAYELADGDAVAWYHADSMESTPENTDMLIRIETSYDFWSGDVALGSGTFNVTADDSGKEYTINRTCALAALIRAAEKGGFNYTISDSWYESWGSLSVTSIAGRESDPVTWDGWCYWVNYPDDPMPMVGGNKFELNDGDVVEWYYGGMGSAPNNTDMLIRIETSYDFWSGDVSLGSGTFNVTADSGVEYTINRTCALASIIGAAKVGGFDYTINDSWYESYGTIYVDAIDGVSGWMYWVNYPDDSMPMVGANAYELADGDAVAWYHADSMESTPENTDMLIRIGVSFAELGDANHDGAIDTADAVFALRMAVGAVPPNDAADVNRDGCVTSLDALMIMQAVAGAITI